MIVAMVNMFKQDDKIEHLTHVEWLYRWSRIGRTDTEDYQDFERRMLFGKKEEREGMKTKIFNLERNAPQFLYFNPTDDRKPNPPDNIGESVPPQRTNRYQITPTIQFCILV